MDGSRQQGTPARGNGTAEFFIPNLCAPRPMLLMILLSQLLVLVYALASSSLPRFDWNLLATTSLFVHWVVLTSAALLCRLREPLGQQSLERATAVTLVLVCLVTVASSALALLLLPQLRPESGPWWLLRNALVAMVLTGLVLRYFYLQQQLRLREQSELQARLDSLRSRIRPHFLFNTLNSIASLISLRPAAAEQAVEDLSELFRASLQESRNPTTVGDELRLCELYLEIEQLRLGERLRVDWQVPGECRALPMPSLLLQPLVENAVYHGIAQLPEGGEVRVRIERRDGQLEVRVDNPVPPRPARSSGHQLAQFNIEQRLQALFGKRGRFRRHVDDGRYTVELAYPLEDAA